MATHFEPLRDYITETFLVYSRLFRRLLNLHSMFIGPRTEDHLAGRIAQLLISRKDVGQDQRV
jgi:hypothetical protein